MKTLFLTTATSIASGLALYYIARTALVSLIWLFDVTLTNDQRLFVHELGFPTFLVGMVLGGRCWVVRWWCPTTADCEGELHVAATRKPPFELIRTSKH